MSVLNHSSDSVMDDGKLDGSYQGISARWNLSHFTSHKTVGVFSHFFTFCVSSSNFYPIQWIIKRYASLDDFFDDSNYLFSMPVFYNNLYI